MHSRSLGGAARLLAAVAVLVVSATSLAAQRPPPRPDQGGTGRPEIRRLNFTGLESFSEDEIRRRISTEESRCTSLLYRFTICPLTRWSAVWDRHFLDREELALDVLRIRVFYWRQGYRATEVDTLVQGVAGDAVAVTFAVREGPPTVVSSITVGGADTVLTPARLDRLLLLRPGDPLSLPKLDSTVIGIRNALFDRGHSDAVIDTAMVVDAANRSAAIAIAVDPRWVARVSTIQITGLERLSERTVRNSLSFQEGSVFRQTVLLRSQRDLYESSLFQRANLEVVGADSLKAVTVAVREADLQTVRVGAGFNTIEFIQLDGRYTHFNFLGGARRLNLQATVGNLLASQLQDQLVFRRVPFPEGFAGDRSPFLSPNWLLSADLQQRWFRNPNNTISAGAFAHRRATPAVVIDRGQGVNATFTRRVAPRANLSGVYRFEVTRVEAGDVYFCVNFGVCDPVTIDALTESQRLSPLLLFGTVERTNSPVSPSQGYRARLDAEHASSTTGSDFAYHRLYGEAAAFRPMLGGVVGGRVRVGWARALETQLGLARADPLMPEEILHPRKRFYAGGARSVRGYGENQLGPRVLTIAPSRLTELGCTPPFLTCTALNATTVDEAGNASLVLRDRDFEPRPIGGTAMVEMNVEYRVPLTGSITGAAFVDGAILTAGDRDLFDIGDNFGAVTPGVGVRYESPVGPIRVDLGYNPLLREQLPVLTQAEVDGERRIVQVGGALPPGQRPLREYAPGRTERGFQRLLYRFVLHLSIGEAF